MTLTETEIFARLTALHSALAEKLGGQPYLGGPDLHIDSNNCWITLWDKSVRDGGSGQSLHRAIAGTVVACFAAAEAFVAAMPDPVAKAKHDWHRKLGDVIDEGHSLALPDDVMMPLRASSQAMHKNLLAAPEGLL